MIILKELDKYTEHILVHTGQNYDYNLNEIFFRDLCTFKELDSMTQRVTAAKLLLSGETYEQIIAKTEISSATLSRVSRCVKHGEGYKKFIK